jgi:actin-binding protein anillin
MWKWNLHLYFMCCLGILGHAAQKVCMFTAHRRQAALHEIQRLKVEGSLRPVGYSSELMEQGSLIITNITLPLKKEYLRTMAAGDFPG